MVVGKAGKSLAAPVGIAEPVSATGVDTAAGLAALPVCRGVGAAERGGAVRGAAGLGAALDDGAG